MLDEYLWVQKYRPKTVADTILPDRLKKVFQQFVDQKNIPNLLLAGSAGVGKTTIAKAMLDQLGSDYITINGSMNGNIDTLRNEIQQFASAVSLSGGRKYVILDEADHLNPQSFQPALRNFMEEFSKNCGFILTCNFPNKIIEPLHSRCSVVLFDLQKEDKALLAKQVLKRYATILDQESVKYDKQVLAQLVMKWFPDFRRILNELQRYAATGAIDTGILTTFKDVSIKQLMDDLKNQNFTNIRKWVGENSDVDQTDLFRKVYTNSLDMMTPASIAQTVVIIAKYLYQSSFCADSEINIMACLTEIMIGAEWK
jgi:DNA polymerase III delta prime subunit